MWLSELKQLERVQELVAEEEWVQRRVEVEELGQVEEDSSAVEVANERFRFAVHRMGHSSTLKNNQRLPFLSLLTGCKRD